MREANRFDQEFKRGFREESFDALLWSLKGVCCHTNKVAIEVR